MFGAMSRTTMLVARLPDRRARSTNSRERSVKVCARTALATQGHVVRPMNTPSNRTPRVFRYAPITNEQDQRRDHDHDVGEHLQHLVEQSAAVARGEAEGHADQRRAQRAERSHQVARRKPLTSWANTSWPK